MASHPFHRPSVRYSNTPEPVTPYQKAQQVWDERLGSARVQANNWRLAALVRQHSQLCWVLRSQP